MGAAVAAKGVKQEKKNSKENDLSLPGNEAEVKTVETAPAWENPLVPNALLREIYQKMVEIRLLGGFGVSAKKKPSGWGQEACRVSVVQGLGAGDLVMDSQSGGAMDHLLGATLPEVLRSFKAEKPGKKISGTKKPAKELAVYLEDAEERLFAGMGAALLLKKTGGKAVIFVKNREASNGVLRRALTLAADRDLPVIVVVLAKAGEGPGKSDVGRIAHRCGVPCIAVDGADAIALYRVAQESLERIRGGGGPVLIECVAFQVEGKGRGTVDPVEQMSGYLLERKVGTEAWMNDVKKRFTNRLSTARPLKRA
jgi:TPP-dependent pyruvate/acetoin dehydrogenase alpha subunit